MYSVNWKKTYVAELMADIDKLPCKTSGCGPACGKKHVPKIHTRTSDAYAHGPRCKASKASNGICGKLPTEHFTRHRKPIVPQSPNVLALFPPFKNNKMSLQSLWGRLFHRRQNRNVRIHKGRRVASNQCSSAAGQHLRGAGSFVLQRMVMALVLSLERLHNAIGEWWI